MNDPYSLLGIEPDADDETIRRRYLELVRQFPPEHHPEKFAAVRAAYERTIAACRKHGKHVGVGGLAGRPDLVAEYVKMGERYVSTGTDLGFLMAGCVQKAQQVRDIKIR